MGEQLAKLPQIGCSIVKLEQAFGCVALKTGRVSLL
jgi:hypothetical protein